MRIRFYTESPDPGPGGAEQFLAVLAEALSHVHEVVVVHHKRDALEMSLPRNSGCDLSRVKFLRVGLEAERSVSSRWRRDRSAREWRREVSENCDLFVAIVHNKPPFSVASKSVLLILFPTFRPLRVDREWKSRLATYPIKLAISNFSREWSKRRWGIESAILHPPVIVPRESAPEKEDRILCVGRFATTGHTKKQIELIETFRAQRYELASWQLTVVGGLNETLPDRLYFESARQKAKGLRAQVLANVERAQLLDLYRRSRIFWHAAGLGEDLALKPEQAEHFGLTTVEAMAYGCVPLVINRGGQPEIVEHGISGFVWNTLIELQNYTRQLAQNPALLESMAKAARARAQMFSRERCVERFLKFTGIGPLPHEHATR